MKRIICHWTGGGYKATALDRKHYHFIFENDGREVPGEYRVEDNQSARNGKYAAHTRACNTGSIGLSMACMLAATSETDTGTRPMTEAQYRAMVEKAAALCRQYNIPVTRETVLWHAEVEANLGIKQRGKWDATVLPFDGTVGREACGARLRRDVIAAMATQAYPPVSGIASLPVEDVESVLADADKPAMASTTNLASLVAAAMAGVGAAREQIVAAFPDISSSLLAWVTLALCIGAIAWIVRERSRKAGLARKVKAALAEAMQ